MKKLFVSTLLVAGMMAGLTVLPLATTASAQVSDGFDAVATDEIKDKSIGGSGGVVQSAVNILLWVVGILAVVMIIWSGLRYIWSNGDSSKIASAKNTLIYSIVGLVVAILAYAIVNFVYNRL